MLLNLRAMWVCVAPKGVGFEPFYSEDFDQFGLKKARLSLWLGNG